LANSKKPYQGLNKSFPIHKNKMAPKSPAWTEEKKDAAAAGRYYIKAGDKKGKLYLSGAKAKWKSDPTFTYVPTLRVAGTPAEIVALLVSLGNPADVARQYADSGYTAASADSTAFVAELADLKAHRGTAASPKKKAAAVDAPTHSIAWYAQKVEDAKVQGVKAKSPKKKAAKKARKTKTKSKSKSPKARKTKTKSPKKAAKKAAKKSPAKKAASPKGRGPRALSDKVAALKAGKVMDVTHYRANGEGAKVIEAPSGARSKKVVVGKIAANANDGLVGVKAAAKALGDDKLVDQWKAAKAALLAASPKKSPKPRKTKSKSPRKTRSKSPKKAAPALPLSPASPKGLPLLSSSSPRGLPKLPVVRPPTIGSPLKSPRL